MSTITGNIKILYKNFLIDYANLITVSTGTTSSSYIKDLDRSTKWISSGSDDSTQEFIEVEFDTEQDISRIILMNFNWKQFQIKYDSSGWQNFTNVYSYKTDTAQSSINITNNSSDGRYFEFDSVNTKKIRFYIDKTITADAEKYIYEIYIGSEIGTFIDDITSKPSDFQATASVKLSQYIQKSNGGVIKIDKSDKFKATANLKQISETTDLGIIHNMYDFGEFAIYLCGGDGYTLERGWRLKDLYHVIIKGDEPSDFDIGRVSSVGQNFKFDLLEI